MIDLIKWFHELLIDKGTKWFTKFFFIISILFIIIVVDNYFGWSYYSQTKNQISIIKDVNECLKDSLNSKEEVIFLKQKKKEIIENKNLITSCWKYSKSLFTQKENNKPFTENLKYNLIENTSIVRSYRFFLLNFGIIIVFCISLSKKLKEDRKKINRMSTIVKFLFFSSFMCVCIYFVYSLIPVVSKSNIWINYLIYLFIGIVNTFAMWKEEKKEKLLDT